MVDDTDLRVVAEADYGLEAEQHLSALMRIREGGALSFGATVPTEVLELTRWERPPIERGQERRHWQRAFACTALLRASGRPENRHNVSGDQDTIIGLIDSLYPLEQLLPAPKQARELAGINGAATGLLAWLIPILVANSNQEAAFFGLGLFWFALACEVPDAALVALSEWVMLAEEEAATRERKFFGTPVGGTWLLTTTLFGSCHDLWRLLGARLPSRLSGRHGAEVREAARLFSTMLA